MSALDRPDPRTTRVDQPESHPELSKDASEAPRVRLSAAGTAADNRRRDRARVRESEAALEGGPPAGAAGQGVSVDVDSATSGDGGRNLADEPIGWQDKKQGLYLTKSEASAVDGYVTNGRRVEQHYRRTMDDIADRHLGVALAGAEDQLDSGASLMRKIAASIKWDPSIELSDRLTAETGFVRYSYTVDSGNFGSSAQAVLDDLAGRGFRPNGDVENRWDGAGYGVATSWTDGAGRPVEVELHTPEGLKAEAETRVLREKLASPDITPEQGAELRRQLLDASRGTPAPDGLDTLRMPDRTELSSEADRGAAVGDRTVAETSDRSWSSRGFTPPEPEGVVRVEAPDGNVAFSARTDLEPNRCYEVEGRGTFFTNAQGRIVHVVADYGPKGAPNPDLNDPVRDATYVIDDRHVFLTDELGRTREALVERLERHPMHRDRGLQEAVAREADGPYDGGHVLARASGGGPEKINLFAQLRSENQFQKGATDNFYQLEKGLRTLVTPRPSANGLERVPEVSYRFVAQFSGDSRVPNGYKIEYSIDGIQVPERWFNNVFEESSVDGASG